MIWVNPRNKNKMKNKTKGVIYTLLLFLEEKWKSKKFPVKNELMDGYNEMKPQPGSFHGSSPKMCCLCLIGLFVFSGTAWMNPNDRLLFHHERGKDGSVDAVSSPCQLYLCFSVLERFDNNCLI